MNKTDVSILLIHQRSHTGGGQSYVDGLSQAIRKKGIQVELLENAPFLQIIKKILSTPSGYIIWNVYYEFSLLPFLLSLFAGKKNAIIIYGIWALESRSLFVDNGRLETKFDQRNFEIKLYIKQFLFIAFSSYVFHLSKYAKKLFDSQKFFTVFKYKKHTVIGGGADEKLFNKVSITEKLTIRKKFGISADSVVLIMAGRIEMRKNYIRGMEVIREIRKLTTKNVILYLVFSSGEFNEYSYLKLLFAEIKKLGIGEYVRIVTGIERKKLSLFYKASDIYLMLSTELETFGLVTLEAIRSGLPVFGYKACATPEIVSGKFLFPASDIKQISKEIAAYIKKPADNKSQLIRDLELNTEKYSWDKSADKITEAFDIK